MDPARLLHRIGVILVVAALGLAVLSAVAGLVGPILGYSVAEWTLALAVSLLAGVVIYAIGTGVEVLRDGRQAAGLNRKEP